MKNFTKAGVGKGTYNFGLKSNMGWHITLMAGCLKAINIKKHLFFIAFLLLLSSISVLKAQSNISTGTQISFTGNSTDFTNAGYIGYGGQNSVTYYMGFDNTNLYLGAFRSTNNFGNNDDYVVYIGTPGTSSGTTTGSNPNNGGSGWSGTPSLPFAANYMAYCYTNGNTSELETYSGSAWGSPAAISVQYLTSGALEMKIPLSSIGNPTSLYLTMYVGYQGGIYTNAPGAAISGVSPTISNYFGGFGLKSSGCNPEATTNTSITNSLTNGAPVSGTTYGYVSETTAGTYTATGSFSIANGGAINIAGGTLALGSNTVTMGQSGLTTGDAATLSYSSGSITGGTLNFPSAGYFTGSSASVNNLTLNYGTLTLSAVPTINGTLLINGGNVSAAPIYGASSTLEYNVAYNRYVEWNAASSGTIGTTAGYPNNVNVNTGALTLYNSGAGETSGAAMAGNLTVGSGGTLTAGALTGPVVVNGSVTNSGTITLSTVSGGDLEFGTTFTNSGTYTDEGRATWYTGTGTGTISSSSALGFNYLLLNGTGNLQVTSNNLTIDGNSNGLQFLNTGKLDLDGNTLSLSSGAGIELNDGASNVISSSGTGTLAFSGTATIPSSGSGTLTTSSAVTITAAGALTIANASALTVGGTLQLNGGSVLTNSPVFSAGSTLAYTGNYTYGGSGNTSVSQLEWPASGPTNVSLSSSAFLFLQNSRSISGNFTVNSGTFFRGNSTTLTLSGGTIGSPSVFTASGTMYGEYSSNTLNLTFSGYTTLAGTTGYLDAKAYSITGTLDCGTIGLNSNSTTGGNGSVTVTGTLKTSNTYGLWDGSTVNPTVRDANGMSAPTISSGTIEYDAPNASGTQTVSPLTYNNLTIGDATTTPATITAAGGSITVSNVLNLASSKLSIGANTLTLGGTVTGMSAANSLTGGASSILSITGTGSLGSLYFDQTTAGTTNKLSSFTINRTSSGALTIANAVAVSGLLTITSGAVTISSSGSTAGTITLGTKGGNSGTWGGTSSGATYINTTYFATTSSSDYVTVSTSTALTPTVTVTPGTYTYNGTPQGPGASVTSNTGTGSSYTFSYTGGGYGPSSTAPTNAGSSYTVTATVAASSDGFYNSASSSATAFTIGKATPTVTPTVGTYTYNGSPQGPNTATNTGTGTSYTFSYSGSPNVGSFTTGSTQPTSAGSYTVTATVAASSDGNYNGASSSATAFTIGKATPTVTPTVGTYTYNGSHQGPNAATNSGTGTSYTFSYSGSPNVGSFTTGSTQPTSAGSYTVTATVAASSDGNYNGASSSATAFTIGKATPTVTVTGNATPYTYSGSPQGPNTASNNGTGSSYSFSYSGTPNVGSFTTGSTQPTSAGSYTVTATVAASSDGNYNGASSSATAFNISKATPTVTITGNATPYTYSGSPQGPNTASNTGTGTSYSFSYSGTPNVGSFTTGATQPTSAGSYTVTATVAASSDGNYNGASSSATAFTIGKATPTVTVTGNATPYSYNGSPQGPNTASNTGTGSSYSFSYSGTPNVGSFTTGSTQPASAGSYTVTATVAASSDGDYNGASSSATAFTIGQTTPTVTVTPGTYTYTGSSQGPDASVTSNTGTGSSYSFSYIGTGSTSYGSSSTPPTDAGTYNVTATVAASSDGNFSSASSTATAFSIGKVTLNITAGNQTVTYGTPVSTVTSAGTYTPTGFVNGEDASVIGGSATYTTTYTATTAPFTAGVTITPVVSGLTAANYSFTPVNGTITITSVSQADANYRSQADGNLSVASNWQYYDGDNWITATVPPTSTNSVTILNNMIFDQDFTTGSGQNFTISAGSLTVAAGHTLTIAGTADFGGLPVTFKSDASGTAAFGELTGTLANATNVTVERYIPGDAKRAWRLLSVPTYGGQTINQAWQEGATGGVTDNPNPGYGTFITTSNGSNTIFDGVENEGSLLTYDPTNNIWDEVTSTTGPIATTSGYFLYVRGDRSAAYAPSATNLTGGPTTLRTTGTLYQGTQTAISVPSGTFSIVGNTYASAINFTNLNTTGGLDNTFYVWDPKALNLPPSLGSYITFSATNSWEPVPAPAGGSYTPDVANTIIQSGQAFFVHATGSTGTIQLTEGSKASGSQDVFRPASPASTSGRLTTNLYESGTSGLNLADGNVAVFNTAYSDTIDGNDALKLDNTQENFGILLDGKILVIEARQPVTTTDTIFFDMWNMKQMQYQLQFTPTNMSTPGLTAYLQDNYLGTSTAIDLTNGSTANFTVDANAASSASNRFDIVLNNSTPVPVTFAGIQASRKNTGVVVNWQVAAENGIKQYEVERSTDGVNFTAIGTVTASGLSAYSFTDAAPVTGNNFYRVMSIGVTGVEKYSSIVKVGIGLQPGVAVYPNPVTGGKIGLQLTNMPEGTYNVRLLSIIGQELYRNTVNHSGGSSTETLTLPSGLAGGIYKLEVVAPDNNTYTQKLILN